jgi:hypothetical protein
MKVFPMSNLVEGYSIVPFVGGVEIAYNMKQMEFLTDFEHDFLALRLRARPRDGATRYYWDPLLLRAPKDANRATSETHSFVAPRTAPKFHSISRNFDSFTSSCQTPAGSLQTPRSSTNLANAQPV